MKYCFVLLLLLCTGVKAEDGYRLWLRYEPLSSPTLLHQYKKIITEVAVIGGSRTYEAIRQELKLGLPGLLQVQASVSEKPTPRTTLLIETASSRLSAATLQGLGEEGYIITRKTPSSPLIISSNTDKGVLYGVFHLLRMMQTLQPIETSPIVSVPRMKLRLLNHWDNLNRTVERGYAGFSIWNWHTLPDYIDQRYIDYARANASIGINGTVLTNVNANATVLTEPYLLKVKALADLYRVYGIRVYLTARFSAPVEIGKLKTADPLDPEVQKWWKEKTAEIYTLIPDFGGFLVKANSEGQPGPQDYHRTHADGANMLADALAPYKGIVMWRAFVYSHEVPDDRHKQAYNEFVPLDGTFHNNVLVQVKNGAIDFMPREPFHPLFGAMPKTPLMMEFQVTQEYLGQATNLVFLAPLFKECLISDTYSQGKGSTVANAIGGMAGVANIGNDINWTGHPFAQANWYALGRLAWNHELSAASIADEWIRMSFSNDPQLVSDLKSMMLYSREIMVNYMNPLGLHHIMATGHHYGPGPWVADLSRADWNPVYYHRANQAGIGFDRTNTGSNALAQYHPTAAAKWSSIKECPEEYLLWFHHVPWNYRMKSGRTLWNELCHRYNLGVDSVTWMQAIWSKQVNKLDEYRFKQVSMLLEIQLKEAKWWRNACLLYFQTHSKLPIPGHYEQPDQTLEQYKNLSFPFAPGN